MIRGLQRFGVVTLLLMSTYYSSNREDYWHCILTSRVNKHKTKGSGSVCIVLAFLAENGAH